MLKKISKSFFNQITLHEDATKEELIGQTRWYRRLGFWCTVIFYTPILCALVAALGFIAVCMVTIAWMIFSGNLHGVYFERTMVNPTMMLTTLLIAVLAGLWLLSGLMPGLVLFTDCIKEWKYKRYKFKETMVKWLEIEKR